MASTFSDDYECFTFDRVIEEGDVLFEIKACYESDNFRGNPQCASGIMMNMNSQCLVIDGDMFLFESRTNEESTSPDGDAVIHFRPYKSDQEKDCLAFAIYVKDCVVVCCENGDKKEIKAKQLAEVPLSINGTRHGAIFYQHKIPGKSNLFTFESSLAPRWFLGFDYNESFDSWFLVLRKVEDEVDKMCEMEVQLY
ncbi:hypothetical protein DPEC_G00098180 [Dallia pectoralis]|uniref:Uncharacterized protein n=1 Tax=Dallia pectoralis TaxID=75939 RepID=A0ACC2GWG7_DALPE|nr:hypothetical protein DPEC_G00098180 [Dallia pectoralis]